VSSRSYAGLAERQNRIEQTRIALGQFERTGILIVQIEGKGMDSRWC
jgi:hypothetical protein